MLPVLRDVYGNPSSGHRLGREARELVEAARAQVAACLGARTGGGPLHQRGLGVRQLGAARRGGCARRRPRRGHRGRAPRGARDRARDGARGAHPAHGRRRGPLRTGRSRGGRRGPRAGHRPRLGDAGQQRGRDAAAGGRDRRGVPAKRRARAHRRGAGSGQASRWTCASWASTCSRWRATSSMRRRASARCSSATASRSSR